MNRHFGDALYYAKRAGEHFKLGVREELEPAESRVRSLLGKEREPEPSRYEAVRRDLKRIEHRAEGEVREAVSTARERLGEYRGRRASVAPAE